MSRIVRALPVYLVLLFYCVQHAADADVLLSIAQCESHGRQYDADGRVLRGTIDRHDVGVFQINELLHVQRAVSMHMDIFTTEGNWAYARWLYRRFGTAPWRASRRCWSASG